MEERFTIEENLAELAVTMALSMEPMIPKKGCTSPTDGRIDKPYEEFVKSAAIVSRNIGVMETELRNGHCWSPYYYLNDAMSQNSRVCKPRFWGAAELLFPIVYYIKDTADFNYLTECLSSVNGEYNSPEVVALEDARMTVFSHSKHDYKRNYKPLGGGSILEHYERVANEYKAKPQFWTWASEILTGYTLVQRITRYVGEVMNPVNAIQNSFPHWCAENPGFPVGSIADYVVVGLFFRYYNELKNKV